MSQDTGLFSVRRPREVSPKHSLNLTILITPDSWRHQLQLRNTTTRISPQALEFHLKRKRTPSSTYYPPWPLSLLLTHVPGAQSPTAAQLPTLLIRHKPRRLQSAVHRTTKLLLEYLCKWRLSKQDELCARRIDSGEPTIAQWVAESSEEE